MKHSIGLIHNRISRVQVGRGIDASWITFQLEMDGPTARPVLRFAKPLARGRREALF